MAVTLQLTDGTTTVDFNDGTTLKLSSAFQMNVAAGTVNELVIAAWVSGTSTDTAAATMRSANKLFRKAMRSARERRIDQWVWLAWKPDEQTNTQYARVLGGGFAEVDTYQIGGKQTGVWTVDVMRAGDWWDTVPDGTEGASVVSNVTVYNKSDADGDNWVSIAAREGDLPGALQVKIDVVDVFDHCVIASKRFDDSTEADKFNPHFNIADATGVSTTADTAAPGDLKAALTADDVASWSISAANVNAYIGRYLAYAWVKQTSGSPGDITVAFTTSLKTYPAVTADTSGDALYLGAVELPGTEVYPHINAYGAFTVSLDVDVAAGGCDVYGMHLIPIDDEVLSIDGGLATGVNSIFIVADGAYETTYVRSTLGGPPDTADYATVLIPNGEYPRSDPNYYTRLYFYLRDNDTYTHNDTAQVTVLAIDRYLSLRGST